MILRLGSILEREGILDAIAFDKALADAKLEGKKIGEYLMSRNLASEEQVIRCLAAQFKLPFLASLIGHVDEKLMHEYPVELFKDGRCFALSATDTVLKIAVSDPLDLEILAEVHALTGLVPEVSLATPTEMERCKQQHFRDASIMLESADKLSREYSQSLQADESTLTVDEIKRRTESEPVVKMVTLIFEEAIRLRASDIHIEPADRNAIVRFRIDGMLRPHMEISRAMFLPFTSRIKILADLDIAEKRIPQDGRIRHNAGGGQFDFRVSTLPTHYGEKTVIRILKHDMRLLDPTTLGIPQKEMTCLLDIIEKPQGVFFVTGPTGSGKSSTLFACLNRIRHKAINITTIENPIEYKLEGLNQVQINEKAGVTFSTVLRSILRQDPDVILIGEIRDPETAQIAIQASQTGHLVFSTLHTNDAVSAITRLRDLGIPPYLIGSSLLGIIAQRLVRMVCKHCKVPTPPSEDTKRRWRAVFGNQALPDPYEGKGCEECHSTGYSGRIGVFELVPFNESLRDMIAEDASESKIRQHIRSMGFNSLIRNGIDMIEQGTTTPEELLRVVLVEDILQARGIG